MYIINLDLCLDWIPNSLNGEEYLLQLKVHTCLATKEKAIRENPTDLLVIVIIRLIRLIFLKSLYNKYFLLQQKEKMRVSLTITLANAYLPNYTTNL